MPFGFSSEDLEPSMGQNQQSPSGSHHTIVGGDSSVHTLRDLDQAMSAKVWVLVEYETEHLKERRCLRIQWN